MLQIFFRARPKTFIALLIGCSLMTVGCSHPPKKISTDSTISVAHQDISVTESPQTIPVLPGDTITLTATLKPGTAEPLRVKEKNWKWTSKSKSLQLSSKTRTARIPPLRQPQPLEVNLKIIWQSKDKERLFRESITHSVNLAVAERKASNSQTIKGYSVGNFPRIRSGLTILGDKAVVSQTEKVPYYDTENTLKPLGFLQSGQRFTLINESATDKLTLARINKEPVYIYTSDLTAPYVVRKHKSNYNPPEYYYPVTASNRNGRIIPGLMWKYFDHDSYYRRRLGPDLPHYIPLERSLLKKIMGLKRLLQQRGHPDRISLVSGIRNPAYNQSEVQSKGSLKAIFSRHQYGDAVDLIVDSNADGVMDDLNGDYTVSIKDAKIIAELVNLWEERNNRPGGIGTYSHHDVNGRKQTPYVHLDTRGYKARWSIK